MASDAGHTMDLQDDLGLCTIEASVVTGFEESARGEAKEKFGTDVRADRGKITWRIPLNKVNEVLKMGSVDNCRVVIHTVPVFKFADQHDSLARLQKMVKDIDWESGLKVWQRVYNFPHPIASHPERTISADELVDVVIITNQPPPKDKSLKKNKKKAWGKKKDQKKHEARHGKKNIVSCESAPDNSAVGEPGQELGVVEAAGPDGSCALLDKPVNEKGDTNEEKISDSPVAHEEEAGLREVDVVCVSQVDDDDARISIENHSLPKPDSPDMDICSQCLQDPGEILVGQAERSDKQEDCQDFRHSETSKSQGEQKSLGMESQLPLQVVQSKRAKPRASNLVFDSNTSPVTESSADNSLSPTSRMITESEFASIVISRLTSPSESASKGDNSGSDSPKMPCVTPPPTPNRSMIDNPFFNLQDRLHAELLPFLDNVVSLPDRGSSIPSVAGEDISGHGSSVDALPSAYKTQANGLSLSTHPVSSNMSDVPAQISMAGSANAEINSGHESVVSAARSGNIGQQIVDETSEKTDGVTRVKKERDPTKPTFRVTCNRTGDSHTFDSSSAAASFGSAIITYLNWQVDLKNFDIEVILNIDSEEVTVCLALTKMSLHYRNMVAFGPTTLRATICYNMLRLCRIKNGDFICDPMCGTSAIPIEGALNWTNCYHFGGDIHEKAINKTVLNVAAIQEKMKASNKSSLKLDVVQWDVQHLPLRDKCVDVFVSDLPFGHRMGTRTENRVLYANLLSQMARTARPGARACLLTEDKASLIRAVQTFGRFWQRRLVLNINIGGLSAFVFLLTRTTSTVAQLQTSWRNDGNETVDGIGSEEATTTNGGVTAHTQDEVRNETE